MLTGVLDNYAQLLDAESSLRCPVRGLRRMKMALFVREGEIHVA
jgi:hypothetical protein